MAKGICYAAPSPMVLGLGLMSLPGTRGANPLGEGPRLAGEKLNEQPDVQLFEPAALR